MAGGVAPICLPATVTPQGENEAMRLTEAEARFAEMRARIRAYNRSGDRIDGGGDDRPPVYVEDNGQVVYRASSVGKVCPRALWLARTGVATSPTPKALAEAYLTGANNEQLALDMFTAEYSIEVDGQQDRFEVPVPGVDGVVVRGHVDGMGHDHVMERTGVVEVKCIAEDSWEKRGVDLYPGWREQVMLGMRGTETRICWMVFGRKVDGVVEEVRYRVVEYDRRVVAAVFDKVRMVEDAVKAGVPVDCPAEEWGCPYWQLHEGTEDAVIEDQRMAVLAREVAVGSAALKVEEEKLRAKRVELGKLMEEQKVKSGLVEGRGTGRYRVTWVTPTRSGWDQDALERDGVDLERYKVKTEGTAYVKVTRQDEEDG